MWGGVDEKLVLAPLHVRTCVSNTNGNPLTVTSLFSKYTPLLWIFSSTENARLCTKDSEFAKYACRFHVWYGPEQVIRAVETSKFVVPGGYWQEYKRARLTFRHHIVYDPQTEVRCLHSLSFYILKLVIVDFNCCVVHPVFNEPSRADRRRRYPELHGHEFEIRTLR